MTRGAEADDWTLACLSLIGAITLLTGAATARSAKLPHIIVLAAAAGVLLSAALVLVLPHAALAHGK